MRLLPDDDDTGDEASAADKRRRALYWEDLVMIWQDVVLGTGQLLFALALIPSLRSPKKPHIATSLLTGVVLMVFAFTFSTLGLWWSCASCALCGGMWIMLGIQVRK